MNSDSPTACRCSHTPSENEKRRQFLLTALTSGAALSLPGLAHASQISQIEGNVWVNGKRADYATPIGAGDTVHTGSNSSITFVEGQDAYLLRANTFLTLQGRSAVVDFLRLTTGAFMAVFGQGNKTLRSPQATAGIRGTGVYMSIEEDSTYFCDCYGEVALISEDGVKSEIITATNQHNARYISNDNFIDGSFKKAGLVDHSAAELDMLESLVGRSLPEDYISDEEMLAIGRELGLNS